MAAIVGYTIKISKWPPKNCTHQTHCFKNYSHHAEGLVDPKVREQKKPYLVLDTPEHEDSENLTYKIGYGSYLYQLFSKRDLNS
jgi:hypothetical protein